MSDVHHTDKPEPAVYMAKIDFVLLMLLGAGYGLLVWGVGYVLDQYVLKNYFCSGENVSMCASTANYSVIIATFIAAIAVLGGLIQRRVYRPLLVVIASVISLWGVVVASYSLSILTALPLVAALYGLAFGAFGWIARLREFWITLIAVILLVVIVRLSMTL